MAEEPGQALDPAAADLGNVSTVLAGLGSLARFSAFLTDVSGAGDELAGVDRALWERCLAWIPGRPGGHGVKEGLRKQGWASSSPRYDNRAWDNGLPADFPGDIPPPDRRG